jgi:hypothetical protein
MTPVLFQKTVAMIFLVDVAFSSFVVFMSRMMFLVYGTAKSTHISFALTTHLAKCCPLSSFCYPNHVILPLFFTVRNNFSTLLSSVILMHPTDFLNIKTAQNVRLYLLTPWSRVIFENLTGSKLIKNSPTFYGIQRFITGFTSARYLFLPWAKSIQSMPNPHTSSWKSIFLFYKKKLYIYNSLFLQCPLESHLTFCTSTKSNFYPTSSLAAAVRKIDV